MTTSCLITLLLIFPTTQHAMEDIFSLEIVCDQPCDTQLPYRKVRIFDTVSLEDSESDLPLEKIKNEAYAYDSSDFARLPKELFINILLRLAIPDFLALLQTDTIRRTLCSENIVQRFLLEKRYQEEELRKYIPIYAHNFPIENQTAILELSMLLMTAASAGYTDDFRILLNRQDILNYILEETRAYDALAAAAMFRQVGIVSQLVSHPLIKDRLTPEELQEISELCEDNKDIKKLVRKKSLKDKALSHCKSFLGIKY